MNSMKTDKNGVLTQEYIDYVKGLEREDLERFYMGADLYCYSISNDNKRLHNIIDKAIEYIELNCWNYSGLIEEKVDELEKILKGEDNE